MDIFLRNTLTNNKDKFEAISSGEVGLYTCGPTVYSHAHIGNMRSYIFSDTLKRVLQYNDYKVKQIINITDVGHLTDDGDAGEDKVEVSAKKSNRTAQEITKQYTDSFYEDLKLLNIDTIGTKFPKASDHIQEQIKMIQSLEDKNLIYQTSDGVYFDTSKNPNYGKLGQVNLSEDENYESRLEENKEKKNSTDFALWKFSKEGENRQQEWESPWGVGFPGWHIECSAMSQKYLGDSFDIHTGGIDHIPIHHNNEISQSESVTKKPQANYWLHHSHVMIEGEKISKSLGNTILISDIEEKGIPPLVYRYWILTADYRTLVNFTWEAVTASKTAYHKLLTNLSNFESGGKISEEYKNKFLESINDDLNTAKGIALIWDLIKDDKISDEDKKATILDFDKVLGLDLENQINIQSQSQGKNNKAIPKEIENLRIEREEARNNKDFEKADILRDKMLEMGFEIKDDTDGSKVMRK